MPDFRSFVRDRVSPLGLSPDRERKVVEEWAAQLEDAYDALRAGGLSEEEALVALEQQAPDWSALCSELLDAEPPVVRLANRPRESYAARPARAALRLARASLAAGLTRDLQGSVRLLVKQPGFSATVILTLAVCLGANAAIFTTVNTVLLRPLPISEPDRVVALGDVYPTITPDDILSNDAPSYFDRLEALTALEEQALFAWWFDTLVIDGVPQELRGMTVTPSLFRLLRVAPALGRTFTDAEGEPGEERRIILSHSLWQRMYGGDPAAIGRSLRLGWTGRSYTIVGVMPPGFSFFDRGYDGHAVAASRGAQFWIPLALTPEQKSDEARTRYRFFHVGRLRPGATIEHVKAQVDSLNAANVKRFPQFDFDELGMYTAVTPLQEALTRHVRRPLYLLWAGAAFVLFIGAINIANLSLARASARRRELATRLALGARRWHVARQLVIEALLPAALGGVAALGVGAAMLRALAFAGLENLPNAAHIRIDATAGALVVLVSLAVGMLIGLVPAIAAGGVNVNQLLGDGNRSGTAGHTARVYRRALVVTQVAIAVVLLFGATVLLTSLRHLLRVDAGFTSAGVVSATIFPPPSRYPNQRAVVALSSRILERVRAIPGVEAAGLTSNIALSGSETPSTVIPAERRGTDDAAVLPSVIAVSPGYFEAMGTPLLRGRYFTPNDREDTERVAIVDERLASRFWPSGDPIGRQVYRGDTGPFTVIGVVRDVRYAGLAGSSESAGAAYFPDAQAPPVGRLRWIAVKSRSAPADVVPALRAALVGIDPVLPLADVQTMDERTARSVVSHRLAGTLSTMFASVALFLTMLGIYGVLAGLVARRTREIGIRMALGSSVRGIFALVLGEGVVLIALGLALGAAGALAIAGTLDGLVYGVRPSSFSVLASVVFMTGSVALLACVVPARRAAHVDPVDVLSES